MVGTWLLELYLDQLNRSLLVVNSNHASKSNSSTEQGIEKTSQLKGKIEQNGKLGESEHLSSQLTERLRSFLKRNVEVLDVNVTVSLLAGYGRLDDLMEYASYRKVRYVHTICPDVLLCTPCVANHCSIEVECDVQCKCHRLAIESVPIPGIIPMLLHICQCDCGRQHAA